MKINSIEDLIKYHTDMKNHFYKRCNEKNDSDIQEFFDDKLETHTQALEVLTKQVKC